MAVPSRITDLSATAATNPPAGTDTVGTTLDDYFRAAYQIMKGDLAHKGADIASASTTDLGAVQGFYHDITGSTSITSFGTVAAGIPKVVQFDGALTLTHSANLILPGAANITTAAGDVGWFISEASGVWRCLAYMKAASIAVTLTATETLTNKTLTSPTITTPTLTSPTSSGTLTHNGAVDISGASGGQIVFPGTQNASAGANTLDDYEEGTWTPSLGGTATYTLRSGFYTKVGNLVFIRGVVVVSTIGTGSTTVISGLPFAVGGAIGICHCGITDWQSAATAVSNIFGRLINTQSDITLQSMAANNASSQSNAIFQNSTTLQFSGCYSV